MQGHTGSICKFGATSAAALAVLVAAWPAGVLAQDFHGQCLSARGPAQVEACLAALRYDPRNPELMRRLGDAMLSINRPGGAFDAYSDALSLRPDMLEARSGRDEALRQIAGGGQAAPAVVAVPQPVLVPVQPVPPPSATPVAAGPFDGRWSGRFEPRGQSFSVNATIVGGQLKLFYEDSTDRVTLEGLVDHSGQFSGKGLFKDKNKSGGGGGDPVAITGRFTQDKFDGTGSAGTKATVLRLNRDR